MDDTETGTPPGDALGASSAAAVAAALGDASQSEEARAFLREQTVLVRLQAHELKHELKLRHWSLRVRHVSDAMKLAFEVGLAFIVLALAAGLATAIWSASRADGLVIRSIAVPPSMASQGLTGEVVASKLLDRLTTMQNSTASVRAASTFANDWANDIKVEIPDTGVSLGEAMRYLRNTLGHEIHLSGEIVDTANGIALTLRLDDRPGLTFEGASGDLNGIVQRAAEAVFRAAQPYRYSVYLGGQGRFRESVQVEKMLTRSGTPDDRAWGYNGLALRAQLEGKYSESETYARRALMADPELPNPMIAIGNLDSRRGHDEDALATALRVGEMYRGPGARELDSAAVKPSATLSEIKVAELTGDYRVALREHDSIVLVPGVSSAAQNTIFSAIDEALSHDLAAARARLAGLEPADLVPTPNAPATTAFLNYARGMISLAGQDWTNAIKWFELSENVAHAAALASKGSFSDRLYPEEFVGPWLAYAYAMRGEQAKADAILKTLAPDCYLCTRLRGRVDAARGNWRGAADWFADATRQGPSLPFADTDWGAMLLARGDYDAAIDKFHEANLKGPHFADPLEMWGEALMAKNRSDLALAKFDEANKYAPNWGRLHLKWGEALMYAGKKDESQKQFAIAGNLDLTPGERSELAKMRIAHG
jgi:tetratricopeptide (TPR) repeat protein